MVRDEASGLKLASIDQSSGRKRHSTVDERLIENLLRLSANLYEPQDTKRIAAKLEVPYSTLTAAIRRMSSDGRIVTAHLINQFLTRFCHEFILSIALNGSAFAHAEPGHQARRVSRDNGTLANRGMVERFIDRLLSDLESAPEYRSHLIVTDAVLLHGSPDRDVELSIVTDDGSYSIGRWVRNELTGNPCIRQMHTIIVGYRLSRNGYSGQDANRVNGHVEKTAEV